MEENKEKETVEEIVASAIEEQSVGDNLSSDLVFKLNEFEGPLDVLIALIKHNKMEIETVKLSEITEQYLALMDQAPTLDMDIASEFIDMAATLIEIKSKALLPKADSEEEEEDPEELLRQRMLEYELFKKQAEVLKPFDNVNKFYREPDAKANKFRIVIKDMQLDLLLDAFSKLLVKVNNEETKEEPKEIKKEQFTVAQKIASLKDTLLIRKKVMFSELFEHSSSRNEIITIFMALLELLKLQEIKVVQQELYTDIEIIKNEDEDRQEYEVVEAGEEN